jgi:hypothetical protein
MKHFSALLCLLALAGCSGPIASEPNPLKQWIGVEVTVQFKRDHLGASGNPVAPNTTWLNNTKVSLDGRILSVHEDGIFFDSHYKMNSGDSDQRHSLFWIPHHSILTVEKKLK